MVELFDIIFRKRAALLRAAALMTAALFLLLCSGMARVAYAQDLEVKPNGATTQVTESPIGPGTLRDSLKVYLSTQQPLKKKNTEAGGPQVGVIDTNIGEMKALPSRSPLERNEKPTVGRAALVSIVYGTLAGTSATFITTLSGVSANSSYTFSRSVPPGQPAPPSFVTHSTVSATAPSVGLGAPQVTHKITIASDATPGTYSFVIEYAFYTSSGTYVGLEWLTGVHHR